MSYQKLSDVQTSVGVNAPTDVILTECAKLDPHGIVAALYSADGDIAEGNNLRKVAKRVGLSYQHSRAIHAQIVRKARHALTQDN